MVQQKNSKLEQYYNQIKADEELYTEEKVGSDSFKLLYLNSLKSREIPYFIQHVPSTAENLFFIYKIEENRVKAHEFLCFEHGIAYQGQMYESLDELIND
jgi:hypothetical protein